MPPRSLSSYRYTEYGATLWVESEEYRFVPEHLYRGAPDWILVSSKIVGPTHTVVGRRPDGSSTTLVARQAQSRPARLTLRCSALRCAGCEAGCVCI